MPLFRALEACFCGNPHRIVRQGEIVEHDTHAPHLQEVDEDGVPVAGAAPIPILLHTIIPPASGARPVVKSDEPAPPGTTAATIEAAAAAAEAADAADAAIEAGAAAAADDASDLT